MVTLSMSTVLYSWLIAKGSETKRLYEEVLKRVTLFRTNDVESGGMI